MKDIKAVIIGFAHMHCNEISLYIAEEPAMSLAGIADVAPEITEPTAARYTRAWNMANVAEQHDLTPYEDYRVMLDELKPDLAFILCENAVKAEVSLECARRGINISIEKPMSDSLESALLIESYVKRYNILAVVNWPVVWRRQVNALIDAYAKQPLGGLIKLRYINGHTGPLGVGARHRGVQGAAEVLRDEQRSKMWWYRASPGGGAFLDMQCYGCLYSNRFIPETPIDATAVAMNLNTPYCECEDNTSVIIRYPGVMSSSEGTWTIPNAAMPAGPALFCRNGVMWIEKTGGGFETRAMDIYGEPVSLDGYTQPETLRHMPTHLAAHLLDGGELIPAVTLGFNIQVMALLDAAMKSAASGRTEPVRSELWAK